MAGLMSRLEQSLLWRVWERMLEIEFVDRSIALAGKAFASFFPLIIVIAALLPAPIRASIIRNVTELLGIRGDALETAQAAFASADDVRQATSVLGLVLTILFAVSFTTALQRVYLRAWRRPPRGRIGRYWRGAVWMLAMLTSMALLGSLRGVLEGGLGTTALVIISLAVLSGLWWFTAWLLLLGDVRPRVLIPTGVVTGIAITLFSTSAVIWMPGVVEGNEAQFGFFGIALSLVSWFSGAAMCMLVGACVGPVFSENTGWIGRLVRGRDPSPLRPGSTPSLSAPSRELGLRDAFQTTEY